MAEAAAHRAEARSERAALGASSCRRQGTTRTSREDARGADGGATRRMRCRPPRTNRTSILRTYDIYRTTRAVRRPGAEERLKAWTSARGVLMHGTQAIRLRGGEGSRIRRIPTRTPGFRYLLNRLFYIHATRYTEHHYTHYTHYTPNTGSGYGGRTVS